MVLTGQQHVSVEQFARTITDAYHQTMSLHFDTMTGAGQLRNNAPKKPILYGQFLARCNANLASHSEIHILNQIGPMVQSYFGGLVILGPLGTVTITSPGVWTGIPVVQNMNFNIMLTAMITCFKIHIMTLQGIYVSSVVPGVTSVWSGTLFQTLP